MAVDAAFATRIAVGPATANGSVDISVSTIPGAATVARYRSARLVSAFEAISGIVEHVADMVQAGTVANVVVGPPARIGRITGTGGIEHGVAFTIARPDITSATGR